MTALFGWICVDLATEEGVSAALRMASCHGVGTQTTEVAGCESKLVVIEGPCRSDLATSNEIICAVVGSPRWADAELAEIANRQGLARSFIAGYLRFGEQLLERLRGAFALAIAHHGGGSALLAIDRSGIHPLAFAEVGGGIVFATRADSVAAHPRVSGVLDVQGLYHYLYFHMIPAPATAYAGVRRLLPGEMIAVRSGRTERRRYWRMHYEESGLEPEAALKRELVDQLTRSVNDAAQGRTSGAFLSGGTDSSTIAGLLARTGAQPASTYSIGFDAEGYDEMAYARIAAKHFGTAHHEYYVTPGDVIAAVPAIAAAYDQPFGNASAVPTYYCARLACANGVGTLLAGDGGDELFGGNARYAKQFQFQLYERIPHVLRRALIEPALLRMPGSGFAVPIRKARSYVEQARIPLPARLETYNLLDRYGVDCVLEPDVVAQLNRAGPLALLDDIYRDADAGSWLNRLLALDLRITLADNDFPKVTRMCYAAGVDVAFPMMHEAVVDFSARLAPSMKLHGTKLRYLYKQAFSGFLPPEIIAKEKHGFGLPFGVWLSRHADLREFAFDTLAELRRSGWIRPAFLEELTRVHVPAHPAYHGTMVWVLVILQHWLSKRASLRSRPRETPEASTAVPRNPRPA